MYIKDDLTSIILLSMFLGYSAVWGTLIRNPRRHGLWFVIAYGILLIIPMFLAIPLNNFPKIIAWIAAIILIWFYHNRPNKFPEWLWDRRFGLAYFGIVMILILTWAGISNDLLLLVWIGIPSFVANFLALRRILLELAPIRPKC